MSATDGFIKQWRTVPGLGATSTSASGATGASALATVSAGAAGTIHLIDEVHVSYDTSTSASGVLQIKSGTTVIFQKFFQKEFDWKFENPLKGANAALVSVQIPACAGSASYVNIVTRNINVANS